jgi:hypothetical protein
LSGFSGIFAGIYALAGALAAYFYLNPNKIDIGDRSFSVSGPQTTILFLLGDALIVLVLAVGTGILLTTRKAKKDGNSLFDTAAKKLIINLCIPLITGGIFCLALIYRGDGGYLSPAMLIFYGLALVHASKYTRDDVRSLGLTEVGLGLITLFMPGYGLIAWAIGFGIMHIVYGTYMYFKYEK